MTTRALVLSMVIACGCQRPPEAEAFPVRFTASDEGRPLAGVTVWAGSVELGRSGPDGALDAAIPGRAGRTVRLRAECPLGYRSPDELAPLVLRRSRPVSGGARAARIEITCRPEQRIAMLLVRAGVAGLPVVVDGNELARTDGDGLAHVELSYAPHTELEVVLRTDGHATLSPRDPLSTFTMPDADEIFVFDQAFVDAPAPQARRRRREGPRLPERITSARAR